MIPNKVTPILGIDGDMWYLLLGSNIQSGKVAFGRTISGTIKEFEKSGACEVYIPNIKIPQDITPEQYLGGNQESESTKWFRYMSNENEITKELLQEELDYANRRIESLLEDKKDLYKSVGLLEGEIKFLKKELEEKGRNIRLLTVKTRMSEADLKRMAKSPFILDIPNSSAYDFTTEIKLLKEAAFGMKVKREFGQVEVYLENRIGDQEYRVVAYSDIIGRSPNSVSGFFHNLIEDLRERLCEELKTMGFSQIPLRETNNK